MDLRHQGTVLTPSGADTSATLFPSISTTRWTFAVVRFFDFAIAGSHRSSQIHRSPFLRGHPTGTVDSRIQIVSAKSLCFFLLLCGLFSPPAWAIPQSDFPQAEDEEVTSSLPDDPADKKRAETIAAFSATLKEVFAAEVEVQVFERSTKVALDEPSRLQGYRKKRHDRIHDDTAHFLDRFRDIVSKPIQLPSPESTSLLLDTDSLAVLSRLQRAFDQSRDTRILTLIRETNISFLETGNWAQRDKAVKLREEVLAGEIAFRQLSDLASQITDGTADETVLAEMLTLLNDISPDTSDNQVDLIRLTLENEAVRTKVLEEVVALVTTIPPAPDPPPSQEALEKIILREKQELYEASGVLETVITLTGLQREYDRVDTMLAKDEIVVVSELEALREQRRDLQGQIRELEQIWAATPPDGETALILSQSQDRLIERWMIDLGYRGALFAPQIENLGDPEEAWDNSEVSIWKYLAGQENLIVHLAASLPPTGPLEDLPPPPSISEELALEALRQKLKKAVQQAVSSKSTGPAGGKDKKKKK